MEDYKYKLSVDEKYIIFPDGEYVDLKYAVSYLNNLKDKVEDLEHTLRNSLKYLKVTSNISLNFIDVPHKDLSREFYHTLSYEGDLNLRKLVEKAKEFTLEIEEKLMSRRGL